MYTLFAQFVSVPQILSCLRILLDVVVYHNKALKWFHILLISVYMYYVYNIVLALSREIMIRLACSFHQNFFKIIDISGLFFVCSANLMSWAPDWLAKHGSVNHKCPSLMIFYISQIDRFYCGLQLCSRSKKTVDIVDRPFQSIEFGFCIKLVDREISHNFSGTILGMVVLVNLFRNNTTTRAHLPNECLGRDQRAWINYLIRSAPFPLPIRCFSCLLRLL